ncbi:MAG: hypothetical protein FWG81_05115 [Betaproteobacteria bacterium]|nr:hypothetical protein [Betaproteobacteria bacterium]
MTYQPKSPIRCALLGMNASASYSYEYCIRHYPDSAYTLAGSMEDAQLLLIDVDSPEGRRIAHQYLTGDVSGKVPVILSANQLRTEGIFFLHKPASPETLRVILDRATAQIGHNARVRSQADRHVTRAALAMEEEDAPLSLYMFGSDNDSRDNMFFDPEQYLYGDVRHAYRISQGAGRVMELRSGTLAFIRICARSKRVHTSVRDAVLRSIVTTTRIKFTLTALAEEDGRNWPDDGGTESMESFLWRLAAWTSRGRLPQGDDPNARTRLRFWPNMTRLLPIPHAMRIAALWSSGPYYTMTAIARELMISLGDVHVFYCAAAAIGLLEIEAQTPEKTFPTAQAVRTAPQVSNTAPQSQRGLLGRILSRLLGNR